MSATPKQFVPLIATVFVLLFLWLSAVPILSWYEQSGKFEELKDAEFQWFHSGIRYYDFEIEVMAGSSPPDTEPIRISVRDLNYYSAYRVDDEQPIDLSSVQHIPQTINDSFELISNLLQDHSRNVAVEYDATYFYPRRIVVGRTDNPVDEVTYSIRWFEPALDGSP